MVPLHYTFIWVNENIHGTCLTKSGSMIWENSILLHHLFHLHMICEVRTHVLHVQTPSNFLSRSNNRYLLSLLFTKQFLLGNDSLLVKNWYSANLFPSLQSNVNVSHTQSTQFLWLTPGVVSTIEQTTPFASFLYFVLALYIHI